MERRGIRSRLRYYPLLGVVFIASTIASLFPVFAHHTAQSGQYNVDLPIVAIPPVAPPATTSYYMESANPDFYNTLGCAAGHDVTGIVVLFFGQPWYDAPTTTYGTLLFGRNNRFASIASIETAAKEWTDGFFLCSPFGLKITLALGTSNFGPRSQITAAHGVQWGLMVNRIAAYIQALGYDSQITVAAANDIEPGYNKPDVTREWVRGYSLQTTYSMYNVGSCEGCPFGTNPGSLSLSGWTYDDLWYVHYQNAVAKSLPQVYASCCSASQWQKLARWVYDNHAGEQFSDITFSGVLTQYWACIDKEQDHPCKPGERNRPEEGWMQLWTELNSDTNTAQNLEWSTDVRWDFGGGGGG